MLRQMTDQFRMRACFVGIGAAGAERVAAGVERRDSAGAMVPDGPPDPATAVVDGPRSVTDDKFAEFDVVVTTGTVASDSAVDTAVRVANACASDAITMAIFNGEPTGADLTRLERCFGTVVPIKRDRRIRELATDIFTLFLQPMVMRADYARINQNLQEAGITTLSRAVGTRDATPALVDDCGGPEAVVLGYVEAGAEFTVANAETLEAQFETSMVVTGQATFDIPSGCRLTLLRRA